VNGQHLIGETTPTVNLGIPDVGLLLLKGLAVVGGAVLGGLLCGLLLQLLVRAFVHRAVPKPVLRVIRLLGALTLGLLVWFWVFGEGHTGGLGGNGGFWPFGSKGGTGTGTASMVEGTSKQKNPASSPSVSRPDFLRIEMLGGDRYKGDERFYLIEGEKTPRTLSELTDTLTALREKKPNLKKLEIVIYDKGSVAEGHEAVRALQQRARDLDFEVAIFKPGRDAP
jgi:hypothetical protein